MQNFELDKLSSHETTLNNLCFLSSFIYGRFIRLFGEKKIFRGTKMPQTARFRRDRRLDELRRDRRLDDRHLDDRHLDELRRDKPRDKPRDTLSWMAGGGWWARHPIYLPLCIPGLFRKS